jgi:hypothetical protein
LKQAELPTDKSVSTFQTAPPQIRGQLMLRNICIGLVMRGRHKAKLKKGKTGLSGGQVLTGKLWRAVGMSAYTRQLAGILSVISEGNLV